MDDRSCQARLNSDCKTGDISTCTGDINIKSSESIQDFPNQHRQRNGMNKDAQFLLACQRGDADTVRSTLREHFNSNHSDGDSAISWLESSFFFACHYGHVNVVRSFLEHKRFMNCIRDPSDAFETALRQSKSDVVRFLLDSPLICNLRNRQRFSEVFRRCCRVNPWECPNECLIIAAQHPSIDPSGKESEALISSCQSNRVSVAAALLDDPRVDPGAKSNLPLAYAVINSTAPDFALLRLFEKHPRVDPLLCDGQVLRFLYQRTDCPAVKFLRLFQDARFTNLPSGLWPEEILQQQIQLQQSNSSVPSQSTISTKRTIESGNARKFALIACYAYCRRNAAASHRCALIFAQAFYGRLYVPRDLSLSQTRSWKQFNRNIVMLLDFYTDWVVFVQRQVRARIYHPQTGAMFHRTAEHFHRLSLN